MPTRLHIIVLFFLVTPCIKLISLSATLYNRNTSHTSDPTKIHNRFHIISTCLSTHYNKCSYTHLRSLLPPPTITIQNLQHCIEFKHNRSMYTNIIQSYIHPKCILPTSINKFYQALEMRSK